MESLHYHRWHLSLLCDGENVKDDHRFLCGEIFLRLLIYSYVLLALKSPRKKADVFFALCC